MSMVADVSTDRCINIPRKYSGKILNHFFTKWIARQNLKLNLNHRFAGEQRAQVFKASELQ